MAAEDAVVADAGLHVMASQVRPQSAAQFVRRHGLADGADVVALALDGEQHGAADARGSTRSPHHVSFPSGSACS